MKASHFASNVFGQDACFAIRSDHDRRCTITALSLWLMQSEKQGPTKRLSKLREIWLFESFRGLMITWRKRSFRPS